jgi:membrane associated rhomboid family serine protease
MFVAAWFLQTKGIYLDVVFASFFPLSPNFHWYQIISHMFMHGGWTHLFFNMFALWMFGSAVEQAFGAKKFLILYFVSGLGAFVLFNLMNFWEYKQTVDYLTSNGTPLYDVVEYAKFNIHREYLGANAWMQTLPSGTDMTAAEGFFNFLTSPMLGASGAICGVLAAFGVLFPDSVIMLIFPPIPLKAKYFIPLYILLELYLSFQQAQGDNVAHLAHVGGAVFGFFLARYWIRNRYRWN